MPTQTVVEQLILRPDGTMAWLHTATWISSSCWDVVGTWTAAKGEACDSGPGYELLCTCNQTTRGFDVMQSIMDLEQQSANPASVLYTMVTDPQELPCAASEEG